MTVHTRPPLCFLPMEFKDLTGSITCSTDLNEVTCQVCSYYRFHPEARILEIEHRHKLMERSQRQ